jgi:hypothetical protein
MEKEKNCCAALWRIEILFDGYAISFWVYRNCRKITPDLQTAWTQFTSSRITYVTVSGKAGWDTSLFCWNQISQL